MVQCVYYVYVYVHVSIQCTYMCVLYVLYLYLYGSFFSYKGLLCRSLFCICIVVAPVAI